MPAYYSRWHFVDRRTLSTLSIEIMKIIYTDNTYRPKRKPKKPKGEVYAKYKPPKFKELQREDRVPRSIPLPSHGMTVGNTNRKEIPAYTGDKLLGIAVMHKSNLVPVFKAEDAVEIARMRRG